jgi:protein-disulfide isomerase
MPRLTSPRGRFALPFLGLVALGCSRNEDARRDSAPAQSAAATAAGAPTTAASSSSPSGDGDVTRADLARITGDSAAPLWLVVVSDFQCPYCKTWEDQTAPAIVRDYVRTGRVRMAFVNLPLSIHPNAQPAAEAAMCAGAQDKFWPVHDAIFATQQRWASASDAPRIFDSLAIAAGVDAAPFRSCVSAGTMRPLVQADAQKASASGVQSTPTFLISSQSRPAARPAAIQGAAPEASFRAVLDSMLREASGPGGARR